MFWVIEQFLQRLREATSVPVAEWDERFTTRIAQKALLEGRVRRKKRREIRDKTAAALILQNYLDTQKGGITASDYEVRDFWPTEPENENEAI